MPFVPEGKLAGSTSGWHISKGAVAAGLRTRDWRPGWYALNTGRFEASARIAGSSVSGGHLASSRVECVYMNQFKNGRNGKPYEFNHVLVAQLSIDLRKLKAPRSWKLATKEP